MPLQLAPAEPEEDYEPTVPELYSPAEKLAIDVLASYEAGPRMTTDEFIKKAKDMGITFEKKDIEAILEKFVKDDTLRKEGNYRVSD